VIRGSSIGAPASWRFSEKRINECEYVLTNASELGQLEDVGFKP
jgi:hypothetical protein